MKITISSEILLSLLIQPSFGPFFAKKKPNAVLNYELNFAIYSSLVTDYLFSTPMSIPQFEDTSKTICHR